MASPVNSSAARLAWAASMGRPQEQGSPFADLDLLIAERAGKSIPDIFAQEGEDAFRALETQIVREAGARTGCVLSAGGGVVTREENYAPLHQNGVIVHLRRDVSLLPTAGGPRRSCRSRACR